MKKSILMSIISPLIILMFTSIAIAGDYSSTFEQYLIDKQTEETVEAIITMADQVDLGALQVDLYARHADRQEWHEVVVRALQDKATLSQASILAQLSDLEAQGLVKDYRGLWVGNVIIVNAAPEVYDILVQREDVLQVSPNYILESVKPVEVENDQPLISSVEIGLERIHAPEAWAMGYTGAGRLVSHLDTGVDGNHPALSSRWRGLDTRYLDNPEWAWFDPVTNTQFPFDAGSHGTHTMGTICGLGEASGDTIGVAFGAEWICAGVIDRVSIDQTVADALLSFEWIADPDGNPSTVWDVPDACSNSWGVTTGHGYPPCDETFWTVLDGCEAAGVVVIFAAGNEGPGGNSLRRPADRASTDLMSFAVGAVDGAYEHLPIANFSSRGPSYCTPDGSETIKPEVSAPGVNVRSSVPGSGYSTMSGTSMACPHLAGVVAIIRQANPSLSSEQVKQIILDTAADLGDEGDDNTYGMGVVNTYEAVIRALAYLDGWGTLAGQITDQHSSQPIQGAIISVVDRPWSASSRADGWYYLFMPADTLFDIRVEYPPSHLPISDQQMVAENETLYVDYALEGKVPVTLTASFANPEDVDYRTFYIDGSWDNDGFYDNTWSGDLIAIKDDGESPDQTAGDGIFTGEVLLARDLDHTYSWILKSENYGGQNSVLDTGADFNIPDLNPPTVPNLVVNPSGSDNNWIISVEGDHGLSLDLRPGVDARPYKWGVSDSLDEGVTYTFRFHVMHSDAASYGSGGIGGPDLQFTPEVEGAYDFIFNDYDDSYIVQLAGTEGPPAYLSVQSGFDHHIPVGWLAPGTEESIEMAYDDGLLVNAYYYYATANLMATMFVPESYPVSIDSVMVHVLTEGDQHWPWPDPVHDPVGISIFLDDNTGMPEAEPVFYTETTAEYGEWIRVNVDEIIVTSGNFWIAMNNLSDVGPYDGLGLDANTDYPGNKWVREDGNWGPQDTYNGDHMIRAKVFGGSRETWLGYDNATPANSISPQAVELTGNAKNIAGTGNISITSPADRIGFNNRIAYHPNILNQPGLVTDIQILAGYNLYRDISPSPFDRELQINSELLTVTSYDDWGDDPYGPIENGITYYYQASAVYDIGGGNFVEVGPSNEASGMAVNHPPQAPTELISEVIDRDVNLSWQHEDDIGDFDHFNVYRKLMPYGEWELIGNTATNSYTDHIDDGEDGSYGYRVAAVDDGDPALESQTSNTVYALVGHLPPSGLTAISDMESEVPLHWMLPGSWLDNNLNPGDEIPIINSIKSPSSSTHSILNNGTDLDLSKKNDPGPSNPPVVLDQGGPDEYGYVWIDSDEPGGPTYEWRDITGIGEQIPLNSDDQNLGPYDMDIDFPFYGEIFSTFNICSNGWLSFTSTMSYYFNQPIPSFEAPENIVAPFWDDLNPSNGGEVWYYTDGFECIISYIDIPRYGGGGPYTFQVILRSTGSIIFQYAAMNPELNSATIGIQNADQTIGLQVAYNADYLHSDMAIRIGTGPEGSAPVHYKLYRSETSPVPIDPAYLITDDIPGELTGYSDTSGIVNGTTYYYKLTAVWNDSVESPGSNEASATPQLGGHLTANPMEIQAECMSHFMTSVPLTLSNDGGLPTDFNIVTSINFNLARNIPNPVKTATVKPQSHSYKYDKTNLPPEEEYPPVVADYGGPDEFGYVWIDSDEPNGPVFEWIDISGNGIPLYMTDDDNQGPFDLGFAFSFYGQTFTSINICSNGWLSFTSTNGSFYNYPIPGTDAPENFIAPFWDDLNPADGGVIYYYNSADSFIVSWVDVPHYSSGGPYTFQMILTSRGTITYQYEYMNYPTNSTTIGIQDASQTIGLQVAYNQDYVHDGLAVLINSGWLSADPISGTIPAGGEIEVDIILDATLLEEGFYEGTLTVYGWDQNHNLPDIVVPVEFTVTPDTTVGIADDFSLLPKEFALNQNYPNPFNATTIINYALPVDSDIRLEVYNILGQKVATLYDGQQKAGYHTMTWSGASTSGETVATGLYMYKLVTSEKTLIKKMMMLK